MPDKASVLDDVEGINKRIAELRTEQGKRNHSWNSELVCFSCKVKRYTFKATMPCTGTPE
jgi:hypothetical protein